ncbi:GNAT family N-acetyltransferase [Flavitalea flava]
MNIGRLTQKDLEEIKGLQPQDWPDIHPHYAFYVNAPFCTPIGVNIDGRIVGIGTSIRFDDTAWIAHIIVDSHFRNRGIGNRIVSELVSALQKEGVETCSLIATELGYSVYKKIGFRVVSEYSFLTRITPWAFSNASTDNNKIFPFEEKYRRAIYAMDQQVSGENREKMIEGHLEGAQVFLENNTVRGYLLPALNEGLIIADTVEAGTTLMKMKYVTGDRAVLPSDNLAGMNFLLQNGFTMIERKGVRMVLGKEIHWQPSAIYSRIGGNLG